jgi:hypothetical protein
LTLLNFDASLLCTESDRERRLLTQASYQAMGGVAGTLAGHADRVLEAIPGRERALVRAIFERLVTPERTRAVVSLGELRELPGEPDDIERLVHRLVDARLLVVEMRGGEGRGGEDRTAEIVHESLIERWPTLVGWLDENRDDAAVLARLRTAAAQWQASDRDDGVLWRDEPARQALAWLSHYRGELGRRERAYLDAVRAVATRAERRRRLVRRQVIAAAVAIPMILLAVAGVALVRISRAEREASGQRDELRATTEQLREQAAQLRKSGDELRDKERENGRLLEETRRASAQVAAERDKAQLQQQAAERARDQATASAQQARIEKTNAERAAREAEQAREKAAEAAERARQSEEDRKLIRDRAVGPIQSKL